MKARNHLVTGNSTQAMRYFGLSALVLWLFYAANGGALASSLTLVSASVCSGVAETPILASQLQGVASISIKINYDTTEVQYLGVRNLHPAISNALVTTNGGKFIIAWFSLNAVQIGNDTLMVVRWSASQYGNSALQFDTQTPGNCEITNVQGIPLGVQFVSGSVAISGPRAPQPLNPLRLYSVNQPYYWFLHRRQPCMQVAVLQIARDSSFVQALLHAAMPDTAYNYQIPALVPTQGDSVLWWRMGGVYQGDTSWSASGRMSFSTALSTSSSALAQTRLFPNPILNDFYLEHPALAGDSQVYLELRDVQGRLLWQIEQPTNGSLVLIPLPKGIQNQQLYVHWRNSFASGYTVAIKSTY